MLERNVAVLLGRTHFLLVQEGAQCEGDLGAGFFRIDDFRDLAHAGRHVRVVEGLPVFFQKFSLALGLFRGVFHGFQLAAVKHRNSAFRAHHGDFRAGPGENGVSAQVLAAHGDIGAAVGFAHDQGDLGHRGLGVGEDELGAVADDAAAFLVLAGQEAGHVHQVHQWDVERVAEADEAGGLVGGVDVQAAGLHVGLVGDDADHHAADPAEADDDVLGEVLVHFQEIPVIHQAADDGLDVQGRAVVAGNQVAHAFVRAQVKRGVQLVGRFFRVVGGKEGKEPLQDVQGVRVAVRHEVDVAGHGGVDGRGADVVHRALFIRDLFNHLGTGDVHAGVAGIAHDDEVRQGGGIGRAACAGPQDHGYLRNHAGSQHVVVEHLGVAGQGRHAFLEARAAGVVHRHHWDAGFQGVLLGVRNLHGVHVAEGAALGQEVGGRAGDRTAVHEAKAGNDAVAGDFLLAHAEVVAVVAHMHADFREGAFFKEVPHAVAGRHFALFVSLVDLFLTAAEDDLLAAAVQIVNQFGINSHWYSGMVDSENVTCRIRNRRGAGRIRSARRRCTWDAGR